MREPLFDMVGNILQCKMNPLQVNLPNLETASRSFGGLRFGKDVQPVLPPKVAEKASGWLIRSGSFFSRTVTSVFRL